MRRSGTENMRFSKSCELHVQFNALWPGLPRERKVWRLQAGHQVQVPQLSFSRLRRRVRRGLLPGLLHWGERHMLQRPQGILQTWFDHVRCVQVRLRQGFFGPVHKVEGSQRLRRTPVPPDQAGHGAAGLGTQASLPLPNRDRAVVQR